MICLVAFAPGAYTITGSVTGDQPDPVPDNDTAAAEVTVAPGADLTVGIAESADPDGASILDPDGRDAAIVRGSATSSRWLWPVSPSLGAFGEWGPP